MRLFATTAASLLLAACSVQPQPSLPAGAKRCIPAASIVGRYVAPPGGIMFEMTGAPHFRNTLSRPCPGLDRLGSSAGIVFENSSGGQVCAGDRVRVFDARDLGPNRLNGAAACVLGPFVPVAAR